MEVLLNIDHHGGALPLRHGSSQHSSNEGSEDGEGGLDVGVGDVKVGVLNTSNDSDIFIAKQNSVNPITEDDIVDIMKIMTTYPSKYL